MMMRQRIGKFEIMRLLGTGTMGEVYLARDADLGREVAIKTISASSSFGGESRERFEREARAMAALNHPNIVTLFDFGVAEDTPFLVMEYMAGEDLASLIEQRKLGKAALLEALAQACDGLAYAHDRGVIHRDVKPGNIRITHLGNRLQAKLMDFGIAAVDHSSLTQQGAWMGTISYMAPEYLDTGKATPSADLFAVGVIIYEILSAGRKPFIGATTTAVLNAILLKPPEPLVPLDSQDVPEAMGAVMTKALAKDPAQRYAGADELAAAIRAAIAAPPAPAPVKIDPAPVKIDPVPVKIDPVPGKAEAVPGKADPVPVKPDPPAPAKPLVVGRGGRANCLSLRVALRQAQPGGVILVLPGQYKEAVQVDKEITIRGEGEAADVLFSEGLLLESGGALTLGNVTVGHAQGTGMRLLPGSRVRAEDCCFQGAPAGGVELGPGSTGSFLRCRFTGNGFAGLLALEGSQADLEDCELSGNQDAGLHACGGAGVRLKGCRLVGNPGLGASAVDGAALALDGCELSRNQDPGMLLHRGGTGQLSHCLVSKGASVGIACHQGAALTLADCEIKDNALGGVLLAAGALPPVLGPGNRIDGGVQQLA